MEDKEKIKEEDVKHNFSNKQKTALFVIAFVDLMSFCSISLLSVFFPKETAIRGENIYLHDFSISFSSFVNVLCSPFFGIYCPKLGTKTVFLGGVFISRISTVIFGTLNHVNDATTFTYISFLLRGLETVGASAYFISGYAIVLSMFPEKVGLIRGLLETVVGIGTTIGPAVGEILFKFGGFGSPFYFVGIMVLLLGCLGVYSLEENQEDQAENSFLEFIKIPMVSVTCGVIIVVAITTTFMDPILEKHMTKTNETEEIISKVKLDATIIAYLFLLIAVSYGVASPLWGVMSEKFKHFIWLMPLGLLFSGLFLLLLEPLVHYNLFQDSLPLKLTALACLGASMSMALVPTFRSLTLAAREQGFQNSLSTHSYIGSIWTCMFSIGEIIGPSLGSSLYEKYNFAVISTVIATINITMALVVFLFFQIKAKKKNICCTFSFTIYF